MSTFAHIDHPAQILTRYSYQEHKRADRAGGTIDAPTMLYLDPQTGATVLGPAVIVEPWPLDDADAKENVRTASRELRGDESHRAGCASGAYRTWERASCGTCALLGWRPPNDDEWPTGRPNYAGWARVYAQAREPIPRAWLPAFVADLNDAENDRYRDALRRDVATYGYRITDEQPGYKLPTPTPEKLRAWLLDHYGDEAEAIEAAKVIVSDDDYDRTSKRAAFRLLNQYMNPTAG